MNITPRSKENQRPEPIIVAPLPAVLEKRISAVRRKIITFDDDEDAPSISSASSSGSVPKSLSGMCLKYEEQSTNKRQELVNEIRRQENLKLEKEEKEQVEAISIYQVPESPSQVKFVDNKEDPFNDIMQMCFPADDININEHEQQKKDILLPTEYNDVHDVSAANTTTTTSSSSNNSSLRSSMNSVRSNTEIIAILREQISSLESRVAELSL